jgi:hypothetical protein
MSIANLKDTGNQGNNMPWQWNVLKGLQALLDQNTTCCSDIQGALSSIDGYLKGTEKTPGIISATGAGSTPANIYSMSIANVGSAAGVINAVSIPAGVTLNWSAEFNNTLGQLSYNATGTTFIITYIS